MIRSKTLEMKFRLDIGRWLERSSLGRESFLRVGKISACLKSTGIVDSLRQRLIRRVTGSRRASRHDLISFVGRKSREQVQSDIDKIAAFTSDSVAKAKVERVGGTLTGSV